MAAFPTARAHAHLPGQGSVEFILIMPVLLTFLFAIGSFAMLSYQNTVIQHSLATLADALPAGWQEQDRNELVRDLVCSGTDLAVQDLADQLLAQARIPLRFETDPALLRPVEVPALRGSYDRLHRATGWEPEISISQTLTDLLEDWRTRVAADA